MASNGVLEGAKGPKKRTPRGAASGRQIKRDDLSVEFAFRFWAKVDKSGAGCWPWLASKKRNGYGHVKVGRRLMMSHRVAYALHYGVIEAGKVVDHLCRNRGCCNPAHMEAVSQRVNVLRGQAPNAIAVRTNQCQRGHSLDDAYVTGNGRRCRPCFNASQRRLQGARRAAQRAAAGGQR